MSESNNYSDTYLDLLICAFERSRLLGFGSDPGVTAAANIDQDVLNSLQKYIYDEMCPLLFSFFPAYWGNSCQILSAHTYAILRAKGFDAELIIGDVNVNGTQEFDTSVDDLHSEMNSVEMQSRGQELHVWVSLGADIILDCGLPDRMIRRYNFPERYMPPIMIDTASNLTKKFRTRHQPLVIGTHFLKKTNGLDTNDLVKHYRTQFGLAL